VEVIITSGPEKREEGKKKGGNQINVTYMCPKLCIIY
jgi:hypothetical protein